MIRPRRSALYLPASNARAIEKARTIDADVVIFDFEDAVAPEMKTVARELAQAALASGGYGRREMVIRTNAPGSVWFEDDLAMAARSGADAVLIPKVSDPADLARVGARLGAFGAPERLRVWAMIETARSILRAEALAACAHDPATRLACFVIGTNDLARETGARLVPGREPMLHWLSTALLAARAHGIAILDGVYNDFRNLEGFAREADQGRDMGFDGKTLNHPTQAPIANVVYAPTHGEVARARAVIAAFALPENRDKGAIALDGVMVERLHAEMAARLLALHAAILGEAP
ncbi:MAG: CoA ester lyase [Bosea sp.]|jgi:citrate lyase subunit beta/citryl-CoA lyase|nr:CoA ester lyase [Bosea sp. (in: a-proteobacteria)]